MQIALAKPTHIAEVVTFFNDHLDRNRSSIYSEEFLCPLGIKAAIMRKQMIVATLEGQVVGACRFYRRKTQNKISLYQFAIDKPFRGKDLLKRMLMMINDLPVVSLCPVDSSFNDYFNKTGWNLESQNAEFKTWVYVHTDCDNNDGGTYG
ncbi:diaminopimelate decarboxylase [Metabacillus crassostreae]|uniref:GNAT family N-acetyltransferase n=1 Tax=Metabacillus crassostreae TaxID=929098 RepID=UPI00195DFDAB|nr:GNAT family N-acetyltransferase [Metabacillus crassostreae]MBM7603046.1 diaminopimelate decarboxylase [Metabacillus crassostreae]